MRIEATGYPDAKRIVNENGAIVSMIVEYCNGLWAVHDVKTDLRLCEPKHKTPTDAMRWFRDDYKPKEDTK